MRRYETIFIIRPDLGEPQIKDIIKRFEGIATSGGGEIIETEEWGFRELAYHIKGERRGYYVRLDYASDAALMNEIERNLKLQDTVLRYLSVLVEARNRRRQSARGNRNPQAPYRGGACRCGGPDGGSRRAASGGGRGGFSSGGSPRRGRDSRCSRRSD